MKYGELIKKIRLSKNMTLRQFSVLTNCDYGNLGRLEKSFNVSTGKAISPAIDTLKQICDKSGYSFRQFLEEAGYIEPVEIPAEIQKIYDKLDAGGKEILMTTANFLLSQIGENIQSPDSAPQNTLIDKTN